MVAAGEAATRVLRGMQNRLQLAGLWEETVALSPVKHPMVDTGRDSPPPLRPTASAWRDAVRCRARTARRERPCGR